jgi:hypothetical protein
MPCVDGREWQERELQQEQLDLTTRVACEVYHLLDVGQIMKLSEEATIWIADHLERDAKRGNK